MTDLMQIQPFIQAYVQAVSSILEADVTVVDSELIRVGGTGSYREAIGEKVGHAVFFSDVIHTGAPGIIRDVRIEFICHNCEKKSKCKELANLAYPIFKQDRVVGVMAIIAFQEIQRERLLNKSEKLEEFLKYMSALIESKLLSEEIKRSLEYQIDEIIDKESVSNDENRLIGNSRKINELVKLVKKVAASESTVLLHGESGTGKEIVARLIHGESNRKSRRLISVNCAAIPDTLVESELFGYEEGAFTGAKKHGSIGKFELANNSTLFLDEIGDMPLSVQSKLLRVLQDKQLVRLGGGQRAVPLDIRIICATNKNLEQMVTDGTFRQDLYYRLNVVPIYLPPLRERAGDVGLLADYFVSYYRRRFKKPISGFSTEAKSVLEHYHWPGNVRELKNMVEYLFNFAEGPVICLHDLPERLLQNQATVRQELSLREMLEGYERRVILSVIDGADSIEGKRAAAERLQISLATFYRKLDKYELL